MPVSRTDHRLAPVMAAAGPLDPDKRIVLMERIVASLKRQAYAVLPTPRSSAPYARACAAWCRARPNRERSNARRRPRAAVREHLRRCLINRPAVFAFGQTGHCPDMATGPLMTHTGHRPARNPAAQ